MAELDKIARTRYGIPSIVLMENAGICLTDEVIKYFSGIPPKKIAVFCGKGNNGGDGFVAARHLDVMGVHVEVFLMSSRSEIKSEEAGINLGILDKMGIRVTEVKDVRQARKMRRWFRTEAIIDAIYGTGFSGVLPDHVGLVVRFINDAGVPVFACDIPSGLDGATGKVHDISVKADLTVTFGVSKTGFVKGNGHEFSGKVVVRNVSYPRPLVR